MTRISHHRRPMMRGNRRSGGGYRAAPFDPLTDAALFVLYRETTVDAGSGACSEWTDLGANNLDMLQSTALARPTIDATDADFNGQPSLSFDGGDFMRPTAGAASDWTFLHDDTDATWWFPFYSASAGATQVLLSTFTTISALNVGMVIRYDGTSQNLDFIVNNGSGASLINVSTAANSAAISTPHFVVLRKNAAGWEIWIDGALALSGTYTGTPSTAAPQARLVIGATNTPNGYATAKLAEVGAVKAYRDAALVSAYGVARY